MNGVTADSFSRFRISQKFVESGSENIFVLFITGIFLLGISHFLLFFAGDI
jgi:hypothetical protein